MGLTSDSLTNVEIVKRTYDGATSEENGRNLAAHAAENIRWTEAAGFPYAGTYVGLDSVVENVFSRLGREWTNYQFNPEEFVDSGDTVVAIGTYRGMNNATEKSMTARVAHVWKLSDGQIVAFEQIVDSKPVIDAMQTRET